MFFGPQNILFSSLPTRHKGGRRRRKFSNLYTCALPATKSELGDRSFMAVGSWLWNYCWLRSDIQTLSSNIKSNYALKALLYVETAAQFVTCLLICISYKHSYSFSHSQPTWHNTIQQQNVHMWCLDAAGLVDIWLVKTPTSNNLRQKNCPTVQK